MSFFRYPGGKRKLYSSIMEIMSSKLPLFMSGYSYREPFFGAGAIGLRIVNDIAGIKSLWINDKDLGIYCIWYSVLYNPEELKLLIKNFTPSVEAFFEFKAVMLSNTLDGFSELEYGFMKLALHQMSYSGLGSKAGGPIGGKKQTSKYDVGCRWSPNYLCKRIDQLNKLFRELYVDCTNWDFRDIIEAPIDSPTIMYLDPPYFVKGDELYQHNFSVRDHMELADTLRNAECSWFLSYDDCEEIRDLYSWADMFVISDVSYSITGLKNSDTGEVISRKGTELLIYNK